MQEIFVPALGMASTEVALSEWLVEPGARVTAGQAVASIETDKSELDVESPADGTLGRHRYAAGDMVPNGATIAVVLAEGETEDEPDAAPAAVPEPSTDAPQAASESGARISGEDVSAEPAPHVVSESGGAPDATSSIGTPPPPAARERTPDGELVPHGLSPRERSAAGAERTAPESDAAPEVAESGTRAAEVARVERDDASVAEDRYRRAVAAAVTQSWSEIPHFAVTAELEVSQLEALLRSVRSIEPRATFTDLILKAYALSLVSRLGTTDIDLALAVATARGVAMPVIEDVAKASLIDLAHRRAAAVERARDGRSVPADSKVPHSALSNLGGYGVLQFTGIIPVGQTSLLTIGAAADRPVVREGELVAGRTMHATLNVDHREWDGQHAGEVLQRLTALAAEPGLLRVL